MRNAARGALLFTLVGCGATALTAGGMNVQLMKSDPPIGCQEVGPLTARGNEPRINIRNDAAKLGANYVRLETISNYGAQASGTAYKCPEPAGAAGPPMPAK
jgi:hypothetical protein